MHFLSENEKDVEKLSVIEKQIVFVLLKLTTMDLNICDGRSYKHCEIATSRDVSFLLLL